jgi:hypothetical protein
MWKAGLIKYDNKKGLEWGWQAIDGAMTKAPLGGAGTGANFIDRGKKRDKKEYLNWWNRFRRLLIRWEKKIEKLHGYATFSMYMDNIQSSRTFRIGS